MITLALCVGFALFLSGLCLGLSIGMVSHTEKVAERGASALFAFCGLELIAVAAFGWTS